MFTFYITNVRNGSHGPIGFLRLTISVTFQDAIVDSDDIEFDEEDEREEELFRDKKLEAEVVN